jgi:hypothetical protein
MVLRLLAIGRVKQGRHDEAAQVVQEVLAIEPQLTLTKPRARSGYVDIKFVNEFVAALRIAGIPE